jgi:hypothetical protein
MEANEVAELKEQHEHAAEGNMKPISFTMALVAVLVAIVTVLGHREHTEAVLQQARASDQWNFYQAKKIRQNDTLLAQDILSVATVHDPAATAKIIAGYKAHQDKWTDDTNETQNKAREFEGEVTRAEAKASKFDFGEALLEIGLVITSITLLTRQRIYWLLGILFSAGGLVVAAQGLLLH